MIATYQVEVSGLKTQVSLGIELLGTNIIIYVGFKKCCVLDQEQIKVLRKSGFVLMNILFFFLNPHKHSVDISLII